MSAPYGEFYPLAAAAATTKHYFYCSFENSSCICLSAKKTATPLPAAAIYLLTKVPSEAETDVTHHFYATYAVTLVTQLADTI